MPDATDTRPIRVRILGREYPLRVRAQDEAVTRDMAAYVDGKLRAFKDSHPEQSEVTAAVVVALALAEELYTAWEAQDAAEAERAAAEAELNDTLGALERRLAVVLETAGGDDGGEQNADRIGLVASEQDGDTSV